MAGTPFSPQDALSATRLQAVKVFDYCITFNLEYTLIWPSRWSLTKILYVLSRYPAFFDVPLVLYYLTPTVSLEHCAQLNTAIAAGNVFGIAVAEAIFVLRTYALSGRRRKILYIFGGIYTACVLAVVAMMGTFLRNMRYSPPPADIPGCNLTGGPFLLVGFSFILVLLNETALTSYTLYLGFKTYRHSHSPLIATMYRDGIMYYVFLCVGSAANVAILIGAPKQLRELLNTCVSLSLPLPSLLHFPSFNARQLTSTALVQPPPRPAQHPLHARPPARPRDGEPAVGFQALFGGPRGDDGGGDGKVCG
ncbi:hypothetical protein C8R46DRAFT_1108831 [Mycena filopes]|nr:hypothetical protein C8R46DRAFT_1108831 [Mycena filopes]